jgi:hypothetical protein
MNKPFYITILRLLTLDIVETKEALYKNFPIMISQTSNGGTVLKEGSPPLSKILWLAIAAIPRPSPTPLTPQVIPTQWIENKQKEQKELRKSRKVQICSQFRPHRPRKMTRKPYRPTSHGQRKFTVRNIFAHLGGGHPIHARPCPHM